MAQPLRHANRKLQPPHGCGSEAVKELVVFPASLQDWPQILELVEEMPDVVVSAFHAMRMQIGKPRIVAIAVEGLLRGPFDEDEDRARLELARRALAEPAEREDPATVGLHLFGRPSGTGQIF